MMIQKQEDKGFVIIPLVLGKEIPDFPFMKDILWVDFRHPDKYRESFYRLLCAIEGKSPGPSREFEGDLTFPQQSKEPIPREKPLLLLPEKTNDFPQGTAADDSLDNAHRTFHHTSFEKMAYMFISYIHENKREVDSHGCSYEPEDVKQSLARLELAFILKRRRQSYFYCVPLFKKMIQQQDPEDLLKRELKAPKG
ncbi:MAG: hypothetical protein PVH61_03980 [Candidatus Aminicenantes bacterium]|jgi:hypothetical protein